MFVIFAFNESLIESAVSKLHWIPVIGTQLEAPFKELLKKQKDNLHRQAGAAAEHVRANSFAGFLIG